MCLYDVFLSFHFGSLLIEHSSLQPSLQSSTRFITPLTHSTHSLQVIYCIENGLPLLLENLPVDIDAVLDPVIGKATMKKGRNIVMKIGDNEVEYDSRFRLYLQTKLANPHYKPEINAQATLVNFCVTEKGLEDQLLALVVEHERPDLQEQARQLVRQLNEYNITLTELENSLLFRLANSQVRESGREPLPCVGATQAGSTSGKQAVVMYQPGHVGVRRSLSSELPAVPACQLPPP